MALNLKKNDEAEAYFHQAKNLKLPSDTERAMIYLQLANINAGKNKWKEAQIYFQQVKKMKVSDANLKEQIKQFEKAFNQRGQMKHLRTGAAMRAGGKRRRPKMR